MNIDSKLEEILDAHAMFYIRETVKFFQENGESPALSKNNPGDLEAKKQIQELIVEARNGGIKDVRYALENREREMFESANVTKQPQSSFWWDDIIVDLLKSTQPKTEVGGE